MNVFATWEGEITTTLAADSSFVTNFDGTFTFTGGTGEFENIKGSGIYGGALTLEAVQVVEWSGEYTIID